MAVMRSQTPEYFLMERHAVAQFYSKMANRIRLLFAHPPEVNFYSNTTRSHCSNLQRDSLTIRWDAGGFEDGMVN